MNSTIQKTAAVKHFDLTQSQLLLWMGQQLKPNSPIYNMALAFDIKTSIDMPVFKKAFQALLDKSDAMRTVFIEKEEQPQQQIISDFKYDLEVLDFSTNNSKETYLASWLNTRSKEVFNIKECLFDVVLIKMDEQRFIWYFNQHHLITDAWAMSVQYKVLTRLYQAIKSGKDTDSINIPVYADYIEYEATQNSQARQETSADYWSNKAKELPDTPVFNNKTNEWQFSASDRVSIAINKEKADQLRALCMEKDLRTWTQHQSLFNIFATLLFSLVYRLSGQQDIAIGTPVHNRSTADFKETPGMFIKVFPLHTQLSSADSFSSLFAKVRDENNHFLRHASTGVSLPALNRGVNVVLNYITAAFGDFNGTPVHTEWVHSGHVDPGHHIRMQVHNFNDDGQIELAFDLNTEVFNETKIAAIPVIFMELVNRFIDDRFQSIDFLTHEDAQLLKSYNDTTVDGYPLDKTVIELIQEQVQKTPDAIAIRYEGESLTYRALDKKANQLAHYLQKKGAKEEKLIAICLDRSLEMMIGLLGIMKSGAAYVPIDPEYPQERIQYMLQDTETDIIVTTEAHANHFNNNEDIALVILDKNWPTIALEAEATPANHLTPDNLIYVIYTSGSTGQPKGVMNEHIGVVNRLWWGKERYQLDSKKDILLQKTAFCFDVSVWELYWPLITGVPLVFAQAGGHKDADYLKSIIEQELITILHFVPPMLEVFLMNIKAGECASLQKIFCSGDALKPSQVNSVRQKLPEVELHNLYGPTEAAIEVSSWQSPSASIAVPVVPIGKPTPNTQLHILNSQNQPCPIGIAGELHIGGIQVARGYHRRPELTEEKFIKDPFSTSPTAKLYKSGDLARWMPDGNIEFLGRNDHQVKIRGFRVELGEIENSLLSIDGIQQSIVVAEPDQSGNKTLKAYFVADTTMDEAALKGQLSTLMPAYMIPSQMIQLEAIPLSHNGKIDRKQLAKIAIPRSDQQAKYVSAQTEFEAIISEIWSSVLPLEHISIYDNFIDIGGDSLMGIRMMIRINEAFEIELPVNLIFLKPTIASLAAYIENHIRTLLEEMEKSE